MVTVNQGTEDGLLRHDLTKALLGVQLRDTGESTRPFAGKTLLF